MTTALYWRRGRPQHDEPPKKKIGLVVSLRGPLLYGEKTELARRFNTRGARRVFLIPTDAPWSEVVHDLDLPDAGDLLLISEWGSS